MECVLMSLCGCTSVDVISILSKKREPFTGLTVSATAEKAQGSPSVFTRIELVYRVSGQVNQKSMEDAVRLSKEKYCSVSAMLEKTAKITYTIEYAGA
jgi:putative redox protein